MHLWSDVYRLLFLLTPSPTHKGSRTLTRFRNHDQSTRRQRASGLTSTAFTALMRYDGQLNQTHLATMRPLCMRPATLALPQASTRSLALFQPQQDPWPIPSSATSSKHLRAAIAQTHLPSSSPPSANPSPAWPQPRCLHQYINRARVTRHPVHHCLPSQLPLMTRGLRRLAYPRPMLQLHLQASIATAPRLATAAAAKSRYATTAIAKVQARVATPANPNRSTTAVHRAGTPRATED
jgi:hypothetical protein